MPNVWWLPFLERSIRSINGTANKTIACLSLNLRTGASFLCALLFVPNWSLLENVWKKGRLHVPMYFTTSYYISFSLNTVTLSKVPVPHWANGSLPRKLVEYITRLPVIVWVSSDPISRRKDTWNYSDWQELACVRRRKSTSSGRITHPAVAAQTVWQPAIQRGSIGFTAQRGRCKTKTTQWIDEGDTPCHRAAAAAAAATAAK